MKVACASCGAAIAGADIDLPRGVGRCAICGAETPLPSGAPPGPDDDARALAPATPGALGFRSDALPWREHPVDGGTRFELRPGVAHRLIAGVIFGFFLLFLLASRGDLIFAIFRAVVGLVVAWPMFKILQSGMNRTELLLDAGGLRIARRPLPERRAVHVPLAEILSFAVGPAAILPTLDTEKSAWGVRLLTTDRRLVELPLRSMDRDDAAWMAARLNRALDEARSAATVAGQVAHGMLGAPAAPARPEAAAAQAVKGGATTRGEM